MSGPRTQLRPALGAPPARRLPARLGSRAGLLSLASALALAWIVAGAVAIRVWAFGGVSFGWLDDDGRYVTVAQNLANGHLPAGESEWFGTRIVFLWPVALAFKIAGASDYSAVAWPLIGSVAGVVAAYLLGRDLASRRVGLIAAGLIAAAPLEVLLATRLRPDTIVPALVALAVWAAVRARNSERAWAWTVGAGALLGAGWSARESALVITPVVVYALWPAIRRTWWALVAGLAVVPALAVLTFAALGGAALSPLTAAGEASSVRDPFGAASWDRSYLNQLWESALQPTALLFLALPAIAAAVAVVAVRRDRRALLPGVWLAWAALYLELGTLANLDKPARYLTLASIPAALLVALAADGPAGVLAPLALAFLAALILAPLATREGRETDVVLLNRVVDRLEGLPPGPVLSDSYTWWAKIQAYTARGRLPVPRAVDPAFLDEAGRAARRRLQPLPELEAGGYLVVGPNQPHTDWPENWGEVRRAVRAALDSGRLRAVATVGEATIYRAPLR